LPSNLYKILLYLYAITIKKDKTQEIINVINEKNYKSYLEVGVWQGDNLIPIANEFPELICFGVDSYSGSSYEEYFKGEFMSVVDNEYYENLFHEITDRTKDLKNIRIIRKTSDEAAKGLDDESLDIVFIDARHDYDSVVNDIRIWLPKVKFGGVLCGHDYALSFFGVVEAVNEIIGYDNVSIKSDSTWFYIKR
jgi:hypothetical protein